MNKFSTWYGVPINELDREKLIEALEWCGVEIMILEKDRDRWVSAASALEKDRDRWVSAANALECLKHGDKHHEQV
jgi:hypothetical protein